MDDIQRQIDLDIEVTPAIEDAFFFLQRVRKGIPDPEDSETTEEYEERLRKLADPSLKAGERLSLLPDDEKIRAIRYGYQMIDNIKKYGIPCLKWDEL